MHADRHRTIARDVEGRLDIDELALEADTTPKGMRVWTALAVTARGEVAFKGVPAPVALYEVRRAHTSAR